MGHFANHRVLAFAGAALFAMGVWAPARADDPDDQRRGVARISVINGDASVRRGDSGDWVAATVNAPLMTGDRIATGPNSRAEVQFDSANVLRIGGNAEIRLTQLEYGRYQMEVAHGTVTFAVLRASGINVEVDTPSVSIKPSNQGIYRVAVNEAGETEVIARSGQVEIFTPRGSQWVTTGQVLMARGPGAEAEFQIAAAPPLDDWDRWNQSRDRDITQAKSQQYVPEGVYGAEDLDRYGTWVNADDYGMSWRPTVVAADWSPYSYGRWAWQDWYGWSWVSYDPWGWAPYHYGRWFNSPRFGWCWYPGVPRVRQFWSPALVAFVGFGRGGGVGFGFGNVGWIPLAPREPFNRWWGRGHFGYGGFNRNINITNINVTNIYRNSRARNGIMGVAEGDFRGGRFNNVQRFSGAQVREAGLIRGAMPFAPESQHLRYSDRGATHIPRSNENTRFFRRQQPNPVERVSFAQQQRAIDPARFGRDSGDRGRTQGVRSGPSQDLQQRQSAPDRDNRGGFQGNQAVRGQDSQPGQTQRSVPNGWRRFGDPSGQKPGGIASPSPQRNMPNIPGSNLAPRREDNPRPNQETRDQRPSNQNRGAWQRFGDPASAPRQRIEPSRRNSPDNTPGDTPGDISPRSDQQSLRVAPPVVRERGNRPQSDNVPRSFVGGGSAAPEMRSAPRQPDGGSRSLPQMQVAPRRSEGGGSAPRQFEGGRSLPRMESSPRGFGGGGSAPRMESSPRSFGGGGSAPRMQQSAPRSFGGGGGQRGGGGGQRGGGDRGQRGGGRR